MRDILFRGKRCDNLDWVEGYLLKECNYVTCSWNLGIEYKTNRFGRFAYEVAEVVPYTVGQFTGLTDKNGKKIFEGDIIRYNTFDDFDCHSVVKFGEYEQDGSNGEYNPRDCIGWYVEVNNFTCPDWAEDDPIYFNDYLKYQNLLEVSDESEVIGNIHDNPDLLKGGAENAKPL